MVSFTIKNIDAREKLKREIEPLLNRNRTKLAVEKNENGSRANSEDRKEEINPPANHGGLGLAGEFISTPARANREAGKGMNPPASRGALAVR